MAQLAPAGWGRDGARGVPAAAVGSFLLHAVLGALVIWAGMRWTLPAPVEVYRVDLVAAPRPPAPDASTATSQKETPKTRPPEEPTEKAKLKKAPEVAPAEAEEKKAAEPTPAESKKTLEKPNADETIRLEGAPFPYPDYVNNLVVQVKRRWRQPSGAQQLIAEVSFTIHKDGGVTDIDWVRRSGNVAFDLEARGAIETAGRQQAFGPLPDGYPSDQLRVVFLFDPARF